jgi:hypothetical protein
MVYRSDGVLLPTYLGAPGKASTHLYDCFNKTGLRELKIGGKTARAATDRQIYRELHVFYTRFIPAYKSLWERYIEE